MAKFKLIVSDPESGKANVLEVDGTRAQALVGRQLGEVIDGSPFGISATRLRIAGGCDKDGIPMRPDVHGGAKKYIVLSGGIGFRPTRRGERRRKLIRGKMITDETYQVNLVKVTGAEAPRAEVRAPTPKVEAKPSVERPAPEKPRVKKKAKKSGAKKTKR